MNVDRMRRYNEAAREDAKGGDYQAWLADMTPEHRQRHIGRKAWPVCPDCTHEALAPVRRLAERVRRNHA